MQTPTHFTLIFTIAIIIMFIRGDPIQKFDKDAILKSLSTRDRISSTELTDKNGNKVSSLPSPIKASKQDARLSGLDIDAILNSIKEKKSGNDDNQEREVVVVSSTPEEPQNDNANNSHSQNSEQSILENSNKTETRRNAFLRQKIESSINRKRDRASRRRHVIETILENLSQQKNSTSSTMATPIPQ